MNKLNIAIGFDRQYIVPSLVLMTSVFRNTNESVHFHILANDLLEQEKSLITLYAKSYRGKISFYIIDKSTLDEARIPNNSYFSLAILYRIFLPILVPDTVKKLLYLDADTLVVKDIAELFKTFLGSLPVGAVVDWPMELRDDLGMSTKEEYFNSGVILIDVLEWRRLQITEKVMKYISENTGTGVLHFVEQDALNKVLYRNWHRLDDCYNFIPLFSKATNDELELELLEKQSILHFAGQPKPWGVRNIVFKRTYDYYRDQFKATSVGKKIIYCKFEDSFITSFGTEQVYQQWSPTEVMEFGFILHLIWLQQIQHFAPDLVDFLLTENYSIYDKSEKSLQDYEETFRTYQQRIQSFCNSIFTKSGEIEPLPPWTVDWIELCKHELEKIEPRSSLLHADTKYRLQFIPQFINDKLMITKPDKSLLFYIIECAWMKFIVTTKSGD